MQKVCCRAFGPPEQLERIEVATPEPETGEVLIEVRAAGVGFVDGLMIQGRYQVKPPLPYFPGSEFAGVVAATGAGVTTLKAGDRVMGLASSGAFADYLTLPAARLTRLPDALDDVTAAGFYINYATALYGLRDCGHLEAGETVLILGAAGGVGSAAICVARALGARVIAAASTATKRQAALDWGADEAIDYRNADWRDELKQLTAGGGLQMVYDPVGGDAAEPAFRSLSPGGRFLVVGFASGSISSIALNLPLLKRSAIVGVDWGGASRADPAINQELMQTLMSWIAAGQLVPAPVQVRPLVEFREALSDQLAGQVVGKLVLVNNASTSA
ncbi:MAG: NADPH:quinone oxidoreductase family protein [Pseudomonadota bacterium]